MKKLIFSYFLLLIGCMSGHKIMTMDSFSDVPIGATEQQLIKNMGSPYAIYKLDNGDLNYEYIERISANDRVIEERHYFFLIRNGKVESKSTDTRTRAPLQQRNSFELQTSQNEN
jgi:hypothetical protein